MQKRSKWIIPLSLLLLLVSSCGLFKEKLVTKTDSIFIDKTTIVTERIVDTIITIKSDTSSYTFTHPNKDTVFTLTDKSGGKVMIELKGNVYSLVSISAEKQVPITIKEKVVEYRNVYNRIKAKEVIKKPAISKLNIIIFLIISILVVIFIIKHKLLKI